MGKFIKIKQSNFNIFVALWNCVPRTLRQFSRNYNIFVTLWSLLSELTTNFLRVYRLKKKFCCTVDCFVRTFGEFSKNLASVIFFVALWIYFAKKNLAILIFLVYYGSFSQNFRPIFGESTDFDIFFRCTVDLFC